jgi:hypothetical protein
VPGEVVQSLAREQSEPSSLEAEAASVAATKEASSSGVRSASKTVRLRDKDHLKFVSKQPRIVCGASLRMRIIFALRNRGRWAAKSAM